MSDFLNKLLQSVCDYTQKNPQSTGRIVSGAYDLGKQVYRSMQSTPQTGQHQELRSLQPIPAGGVRASTFYLRVEKFIPSEDPSRPVFRISGDRSTGELHPGEYVQFRAPKLTPILLQFLKGEMEWLTFKAASQADVDRIRQCVDTYYSCRICNPDYQEEF